MLIDRTTREELDSLFRRKKLHNTAKAKRPAKSSRSSHTLKWYMRQSEDTQRTSPFVLVGLLRGQLLHLGFLIYYYYTKCDPRPLTHTSLCRYNDTLMNKCPSLAADFGFSGMQFHTTISGNFQQAGHLICIIPPCMRVRY
jgi:hypothetical protein